MFNNEKMNTFVKKMETEIQSHNDIYGDSWKNMEIQHLEQRMTAKMNEFKLTHSTSKLISLANLVMLLYIRLKEEQSKDD